MNKHSLIAIDLAKNVFQVCLLDKNQKVIKNVPLTRTKLLPFVLTHQVDMVHVYDVYAV